MTPAEFTTRMRDLIATLVGAELHRAVDALMCEAMRAEGYGDGVDLFVRAVEGYHQ
jgi:hypothetical protein